MGSRSDEEQSYESEESSNVSTASTSSKESFADTIVRGMRAQSKASTPEKENIQAFVY